MYHKQYNLNLHRDKNTIKKVTYLANWTKIRRRTSQTMTNTDNTLSIFQVVFLRTGSTRSICITSRTRKVAHTTSPCFSEWKISITCYTVSTITTRLTIRNTSITWTPIQKVTSLTSSTSWKRCTVSTNQRTLLTCSPSQVVCINTRKTRSRRNTVFTGLCTSYTVWWTQKITIKTACTCIASSKSTYSASLRTWLTSVWNKIKLWFTHSTSWTVSTSITTNWTGQTDAIVQSSRIIALLADQILITLITVRRTW